MSRENILKEALSFLSDHTDSPTKPICTCQSCRGTTSERKAETHVESPGKSQKVVDQAKSAKGRRRKAVIETKTPKKRQRTNNHTGKDTKASLIDPALTSDEALPVRQTPTETKKRRIAKAGHCTAHEILIIPKCKKDFEAKYTQILKLGEGSYGLVYAGQRRSDKLPVAIKHIPKKRVTNQRKVINKEIYRIPSEVLVMHRIAAGEASIGKSAAVSLLDWFNVTDEIIVVMERPVPCMDLVKYTTGPMDEHQAKDIMKQLVNAAIEMHSKKVFHRDLKRENVLIEPRSDGLRVRIIDFGCSCFFTKKRSYNAFGTLQYFPPESTTHFEYEPGPTTVWQLAAILYELLSGETTCQSNTFLRPCNNIENVVEQLNVSPECQDLLQKCLIVSPTDRITLEEILSHPWLSFIETRQSQPNWNKTKKWTSKYINGDVLHKEVVSIKHLVITNLPLIAPTVTAHE